MLLSLDLAAPYPERYPTRARWSRQSFKTLCNRHGGSCGRRRNEAAVFAAAWIFATLILWIIIGGITNRITYIFYFTPIIGGIILGLALFIDKAVEWARRPRQLFLKLYDKPKFKESFIAWSRRRNWRKIFNVSLVLFMIIDIILFWVFSPFNWLWPVIRP